MTGLIAFRVALFFAGVAVFAYGIRAESFGARWAGIAVLGVAYLSRFIDREKRH